MRKLVAGLFISLDGVVEAPNKWSFPYFNEQIGEGMSAYNETLDTVLLGRVSYEEWAGYWPTSQDEPFASWINNAKKVIVSNTLEKTEWSNSTLLKGDLGEEITKLKQQPGTDIAVQASPTLVEALLKLDLVDELQLLVHPVIAGKGRKLFQNGAKKTPLKLVRTMVTDTGVLLLTYEVDRTA